MFAWLSCEPLPTEAADAYAVIKSQRQRIGLPLDENDLWIAATAKAWNATLVSRDSDFRRLDGIPIENWSA